ncbi:MAG: phosphoadenylyl-sulfate reductase [Desulfobacterales bacterium]|nr:phosphoadenylyl-sulfate reductase [Desulfobacterales bacterium]
MNKSISKKNSADQTIAPGAEELPAIEVIRQALDTHHPAIALACSFSAEDIVVLDMMMKVNRQARVFALDTGRLDEETYEVADAIRQRWEIDIEWFFPDKEDVEKMIRTRGVYSFRHSIENRQECCRIRKVEPLRRALDGLTAWITGLRRDQAVTRNRLTQFETDPGHGNIIKVNPIANWTLQEVWDHVQAHELPYNRLYRQRYTQIGCEPCTTSVRPGEDPRAGRWRWEAPEQKECGLHNHGSGI